jgi:putative transposase
VGEGGKAESVGLRVIVVDTRRMSVTCSHCGTVDREVLGWRTYWCAGCGLLIDRAHNAAIKI